MRTDSDTKVIEKLKTHIWKTSWLHRASTMSNTLLSN